MKKIIKQLASSRSFIYLVFLFVRAYLLTVSATLENERSFLKKLSNGEPVIVCLFHQQFFFIVRFFRKYLRFKPCIMISRSRDGEIGALVAHYSGCKVARGSSSKGGKEAMGEMISHLESKEGFCINLVDGPQGPAGTVKPGSVRIAQKTAAHIIPVLFIPDNVWLLNSWDKFMIPKPFSRVTIKFETALTADKIESEDDFEKVRAQIEKNMAPYLVKKVSGKA